MSSKKKGLPAWCTNAMGVFQKAYSKKGNSKAFLAIAILLIVCGFYLFFSKVFVNDEGSSRRSSYRQSEIVRSLEKQQDGPELNWSSSSEQWIEITDRDSVFELRNEILASDYRKVHFQVYDADVNVRNTLGHTYPILQTKSANKIGPLNRLSTMVITLRGDSKKARMRWWVE